MKNCKTNYQSGMTLIEAVIGLAIFALFALMINTIFLNVLRAVTKEEILKEVKQNGEYVLQIMGNELRTARAITGCTTAFSDHDSITFTSSDGNTLQYVVNTGRLQKVTTGASTLTENMTNDTVVVQNNLQFDCAPVGSTQKITIDFSLEHADVVPGRGDTTAETAFHTTIMRR